MKKPTLKQAPALPKKQTPENMRKHLAKVKSVEKYNNDKLKPYEAWVAKKAADKKTVASLKKQIGALGKVPVSKKRKK